MIAIDLNGKVVIVTGCTQGIGLGIAGVMAKAGAIVAGCATSDEKSEKVKDFYSAIKEQSGQAFYKTTNIKSEEEINSFVDSVIDRFGKIDVLISNAGVNRFTAPETCTSEFWEENSELNLKSHWLIAKACYPYLKKAKGAVILMTSNHAWATLPNCFPYNVTKAGITGLVNALAVQWGPEVRVIGLAPGFINTEGGDKWFECFPDPAKKRQEVMDIHPVKKLGTTEEVGTFCAFLCSDLVPFINGTTYLMDGGRSAVMQDI